MKNILATATGAMAGSSLIMSTSAGAMAGSIIAHSTGAMSGSAIREIGENKERQLKVVTATVNDVCQLRCDHCYLGINGGSAFMDQSVQEAILKGGYDRLAIVGKEPFVNNDHINRTSDLVRRLRDNGITTSVITNGMNLNLVPTDVLQSLSYIDVSIDAGSKSVYETLRPGGNWGRLLENIGDTKQRTSVPINGLHTVRHDNVIYFDEMAAVGRETGLDMLLFSPFTQTERKDSPYRVQPVGALEIIDAAHSSQEFRDNSRAFLYLGIYKLGESKKEELRDYAKKKDVKAILINESPLNLGVIRVTHDGRIMTPEESLHTNRYALVARSINASTDLRREYQKLLHAA